VIIDVASQATATLALPAMVRARKWVLIGDHC
jgi:superfamily I DNA and/or RNA helicase